MKDEEASCLRGVLAGKRDTIVQAWLRETQRSYADQAAHFLSQDLDPFRNPIGHILARALPALYDALVDEADAVRIAPLLEEVVRVRAVQDFSPSQAVAFIFRLKPIIRGTLTKEEPEAIADPGGMAVVEARIDEMALLAFDLYARCREQISEIRAREVERRTFVQDRMERFVR
jgi:hypothetical protein